MSRMSELIDRLILQTEFHFLNGFHRWRAGKVLLQLYKNRQIHCLKRRGLGRMCRMSVRVAISWEENEDTGKPLKFHATMRDINLNERHQFPIGCTASDIITHAGCLVLKEDAISVTKEESKATPQPVNDKPHRPYRRPGD